MSGARIFRRLTRESFAFPGRLLAIVASLATLAVAQLYLTWLVKLWTEGPVLHGDGAMLEWILIRGAVVTTGMVAAVFTSRYLLSSVNQRVVERLRNAIHEHIVRTPLTAARRLQHGEWMSRVFNDVGALSGFVRDILKRLIGEGVVLLGALAMMFYLQWRLALLTCLLVPLVGLLLSHLGRRIRRRGTKSQQAIGDLGATLSEQLSGLTTIKGYQTEAFEHARFEDLNARHRREVLRSEWWAAMLMMSVWLVTGIGLIGVLWYGTYQVLGGQLTAPALFAFCLYAVQTVEPLRRLGEVQGMLQKALAAAARVYEVIDFQGPEQGATARLPQAVRGELRLEDVHFRYRPGEPVLRGLSISVAAAETLALVSASGGGKSTLAALLVRFADPQSGRVILDGIDVRTLCLADLRRAVCVVEQDPFVFSGPLIDNIRYGSWNASGAKIDAAVALAGLEPWVRSLRGGLQSSLEEGGRALSGGQKQRIALARAIVRDPSVLVLDEATSALDSDSEGQVFAQLEPWLRARTVLVMAHRLATISRFGRVLVLERGVVVGDGTASELLQGCQAFGRLFAEQLAPIGLPHRPAADTVHPPADGSQRFPQSA